MTLQTPPQSETPRPPTTVLSYAQPSRRPSVFANWFWFVLKNVIGWLLILTAIVIGPVVPGPGGLPLFIIGFGLITFPGKRRLTARVLYGTPIAHGSPAFRRGVAILAITLPAVVLSYLVFKGYLPHDVNRRLGLKYGAVYTACALIIWPLGLRSLRLINWLLRLLPRIRRKIRPWLRRRGIDLLPPRRRRRRLHSGGPTTRDPDEEILEIHERHRDRAAWAWSASKPWLRRAGGVTITVLIFIWILKPVVRNWDRVQDRILAMDWGTFFVALSMFAAFLFAFRVSVWRHILLGFGYRLPWAAALRIWITSELARYLPGIIWQVVGRVYLVKPYGVRGSACTASQILELAIFLLANVLVAVSCLVWFGIKTFTGPTRGWLFAAMGLVPVLMFLLHPSVLYRTINWVMRRLRKPPVADRLGFGDLLGLLLWTVVGLLWQSLAIWFLVREPLGLKLAKWWVVAGAYCLAWCAGFLAFWAPAGIGVRELVFMAAMRIALPKPVLERFNDPVALSGFLAFLSVLLRLWATAGELLLSCVAYAFDYRAAFTRTVTAATPAPLGRTTADAPPTMHSPVQEL